MEERKNENEWLRKYVFKAITEPSLKGAITYLYDKWGALIATQDSFGKINCVYLDEEEYLEAIKFAPVPRN